MSELVDALVIGAGPAGLSVALALARQLHTVVVFDSNVYRNDTAKLQHLVLTWDHKEPSKFRAEARENILSQYESVKIYDRTTIETVNKTEGGSFVAVDSTGKVWKGKKLVLACGVEDIMPELPGFRECWGIAIFHCFFCKGFENRGAASSGLLAIGPLASPLHALHVGRHALQLSSSVTFYTNGSLEVAENLDRAVMSTPQMKVDSRSITKLIKGPNESEIIIKFLDGSEKTEAFMGAAPKIKQTSPFAEQLGVDLNPGGDMVVKPPFMETAVRGLFAAGDCGSSMKVVGNALSTGAAVGAGVSGQILAEKFGHQPLF